MQAAPIILGATHSARRPHGAPQAGALEALVLIAAPLQMMDAAAVAPARNIVLNRRIAVYLLLRRGAQGSVRAARQDRRVQGD